MRLVFILAAAAAAATASSAPGMSAAACATSDQVVAYQASLPAAKKRTKAQARRLAALEAAALACTSGAQPLPFFPQAGILDRDLYLGNSVDLDGPGGSLVDPWCGSRTYDGHNGDDIVIRSFREQAIGVPVFAALDGKVTAVQEGAKDTNYGNQTLPWDNHVIVDAGHGQHELYGHLRRGSTTVKVGDWVVAGQQLGLTGSSGNSSWPHLHLTEFRDFDVYEPWAGPCRPGVSGWVDQPPITREAWLREVALSASAFTGRAALPWDEGVRTGTFVAGTRDLWLRAVVANAGGVDLDARVVRPDGSIAAELDADTYPGGRYGAAVWHARVGLDAVGRWTIAVGDLVRAPIDVVATASQVVNRPPAPVSARLVATTVGAWRCEIAESAVPQDPDYDIVRYRYTWTTDGRVVRAVTTAALSDMLRRTVRGAVACAVTPSDGRVTGATARAGG